MSSAFQSIVCPPSWVHGALARVAGVRRAPLAAWLVAGWVVQAALPAQAASAYEATILSLPAGTIDSRVFGIAGGLIVGETLDVSGTPRATAWPDPAAPVLLQAAPFASSARAVWAGVIAGWQEAVAQATDNQSLRWPTLGSAPLAIGSLAGGAGAFAIAGNYLAGADAQGAYLHDSNTSTHTALTVFGGPGSTAWGVSPGGVAVGQTAAGQPVVFNDVFAGVLAPFGSASGAAYGISGTSVVGSYDQVVSFDQRAFLHDLVSGQSTDLFAGAAFAVDGLGRVVGADFAAGLAMLYESGQAYDLNGLVISGLAGYTLTQARAIDLDGSIVAFGLDALGLNERAFVLRPAGNLPPIPEPSTWAMLAAGLGWLFTLARRRVARHG
jgi:PEP-CTERM motif